MNPKYNIQNQKLVIKGNQPLLLDDPQTAWAIQSGSIALFAVTVKDGIPEGARRYLFSAGVGEALFGVAANDDGKPYKILAVPIEETELLKLTQENFGELPHPVTEPIIALVNNWIEQWHSVFSDAVILPILETSNIQDWDTLLEKLANLHSDFLRCLEQMEQQQYIEQLNQVRERKRLNRQLIEGAIGELASVLQPEKALFFEEGTPLLIAAGAVGRALGITIRPPANSEDLKRVKEPLEAIARASRIRMRRVLLSDNWWKKDCGPLLAYTHGENQPVALLPVAAAKYEIFDPVERTRTPVNAHTAEMLAPVAYMFYRPLPDKPLKALDLLEFALKGRTRDLLPILYAGIAATLLGMLTPQATAILIDNAIPDANRGMLVQIGLGLLAASFGIAIFQLIQGFATLRLETNLDSDTQAAVWDRLLNLKVSFFRQYSTGDLKSRVSAISQIRSQLSGTTLRTLFTSFFSLLNLGLLFFYSSQLAIIAVIVALVAIIVTTVSGAIARRDTLPLQELEGEIFGLMVQLIGGVSKLRVAEAEERAFAYWAKKYSQQLKLMLNNQLTEDILATFNVMLPTASAIIIFSWATILLGQSQAQAEGLSTGNFLAFYVAFGTFINGATSLSNTVIDVLEIGILWERAKPILEAKPEVDVNKTDPGRLSGRLKLDRVTFRYRQDGPLTLNDVTIQAEAGEFIALVGPSGSGKSTIIRLMLGFETPEQGTIFYDGQDLSGLDVSAVRRQLGVVLQNGRINSASLFENISSGALITMDEAWEAARMSGFADDIQAMPMGMHTVISEGGTNLSGGQRQRLLIARSLVLKPRILLFDEATSALDNRTQAIVSQSLEQLQVTRIVIAHRLSTIRNADRIYVLEAGRVVQQGTFDQLVNLEGLFRNLMARQIA
ncbi:MAG: NHLP bacteriocin export ABC transporter permease/ATPase subunit [Aphanothece sp. CMT-3BRIN-NPC111]|jgi:ATP-binding cassette subfamily C protein|nr:NHLP bacteriocin export ABC transporter permease/ATPase subunit [Aphanothece sp. CMT-3BRIN-NPC111]